MSNCFLQKRKSRKFSAVSSKERRKVSNKKKNISFTYFFKTKLQLLRLALQSKQYNPNEYDTKNHIWQTQDFHTEIFADIFFSENTSKDCSKAFHTISHSPLHVHRNKNVRNNIQ